MTELLGFGLLVMVLIVLFVLAFGLVFIFAISSDDASLNGEESPVDLNHVGLSVENDGDDESDKFAQNSRPK